MVGFMCSKKGAFVSAVMLAASVASLVNPAAAQTQTCPVTINGESYTADLKSGKRSFLKCRSCHTLAPGDKNRVGPNLGNLFTRGPNAAEGFKYSKAFENNPPEWTNENLDVFLTKPSKFMPGTKMIFVGLRKPQERANMIAYLQVNTAENGDCAE